VIRKWNATGTVVNKPKIIRSKVTTTHIDRVIVRQIHVNRRISASKINAKLRSSYDIHISNKEKSKRKNIMVE